MAPNDVELTNVFTRDVSGPVADVSFPFNQPFEIVVHAEAGSAIFALGPQAEVGVVVRDLTDNTFIAAGAPITASLNSATWNTQGDDFVFTVPSAGLGAVKENHILQVLAFLRVGTASPDVSIATSDLVLIHRP